MLIAVIMKARPLSAGGCGHSKLIIIYTPMTISAAADSPRISILIFAGGKKIGFRTFYNYN